MLMIELSQHLRDEEIKHEMHQDTGVHLNNNNRLIPQTTAISNIKLPILKKEEYDIWAMEMEHYLEYIDNEVWKVIQNGNSKKRISTGKDGIVRVLSPVTAAEIQAVEKERKAKNILLMAIPKEHMRRFHGMDDAKEIWEAIRTRFGGNANSKKMQKAVFKQQFEAFKISNSEGLEKGYDRFQQLLSQLEAHGAEVSTEDANHKFLRSLPPAWSNLAMTMRTNPEIDTLSIDDLYNNLRVFEQEIQGASKTSSSAQNVAFVSQSKSSTNKAKSGFTSAYNTCTPSTSSTNIPEKEVLAGFADEVIYSLFAKQLEGLGRSSVDLEQIEIKQECTAKGTHDGKEERGTHFINSEAGKQGRSNGFADNGDGIVNQGEHTELKTLCDEQMNQLGDQEAQILAYSQAVKENRGSTCLLSKTALSLNEKLTFQANEIYEKDEKLKRYRRIGMKAVKEKEQLQKTLDSWKDSSKNLWRLIESGMSSNKDSIGKPLYSRFTKTNDFKGVPHPLSGDYTPKPQEEIDDSLYVYVKDLVEIQSEALFLDSIRKFKKNWNDMMERELGEGYSFTKKKCFVCGSLSHLIKDCDYYEKKMAREAEVKRVFNTGNGVAKPVWTNANRVNHANKFVPRSVQLNAGRPNFNSVRPNINTGRTNINSVRPKVNAVRPKVNAVSPTVNTVRSRQPVPHKISNSVSPKRPQMNQINQRRDFSKSHSSVRRPFAKTTAQMSHSNAVMGIWGSAVKTSASYNWRNSRPNFNYNSGPTFIRTVNAKGNKNQLEGFEEFNGGSVTLDGSKAKYLMPEKSDTLKGPLESQYVQFYMKTPYSAKGARNLSQSDTGIFDEASMMRRLCNLKQSAEQIGALALQSYSKAAKKSITKDQQHKTVTVSKLPQEQKEMIRGVVVRNKAKIGGPMVQTGRRDKKDIMLVQVYVDDIIFGSTNKSWCDEFEALMKSRFQMSSMGELIFFLGLQVKQNKGGIFISQDKYVAEILKKFDLVNVKAAITPMETKVPLTKDEEAIDVDVTPKISHLNAVKRIFKYLKGKPNLGLWYPRESPFDLEAFSDSDYGGSNLDRKMISQQLLQIVVDRHSMDVQMKGRRDKGLVFVHLQYILNSGFAEIVDFLRGSNLRYALTSNPTIYDSIVKQFWQTVTANTIADGTLEIKATIDTIGYTITKASIRDTLQLEDATGITMLPNDQDEVFDVSSFSANDFEYSNGKQTPYLGFELEQKIFGEYVKGMFEEAPRPLLPAMLLVATTQMPVKKTDDVAQYQPSIIKPPHTFEEPSPDHHLFSPPQEQAQGQMSMDDLLQVVPQLISRIDSLETDLKQTKLTMGNALMKLVKKGRKSQDDPLDSLVQGLVTPSTTRVNASWEEQVEDISPNTLEAAKTPSRVASLKPKSIDKGRRYKRRKETKGKKVVSSLDFQEEVDTSAEQVNTTEGVNTGSIKLSTGSEQVSTGSQQSSL
ncbi:ribonuclease H-like domain-containing protein [Tanacetum coccineum]